MFPSESINEKNKGGLILVKLKKTSDNVNISLRTSYEDRSGKFDGQNKNIIFDNTSYSNNYKNTGIMKGILLVKYVNLLKNWIIDERLVSYNPDYTNHGLCEPNEELEIGKWERTSAELKVSFEYKSIFNNFKNYFKDMIKIVDDETLQREVEVLDHLILKAN